MQQARSFTNEVNINPSLENAIEKYFVSPHSISTEQDMIVLNHGRWDFDFTRSQPLLTRFAQDRRVFYFEEAAWTDEASAFYQMAIRSGVKVITPMIPIGTEKSEFNFLLKDLLNKLISHEAIEEYVCWYGHPKAIEYSEHLLPSAILYDCVERRLTNDPVPSEILQAEERLFKIANVVFADGQCLYEAKRKRHHNIYPFPSSVEYEHFAQSRILRGEQKYLHNEPDDQKEIPQPRIGFSGVIDDQFDFDLLVKLADSHKQWHFVLMGPVLKLNEEKWPQRPNIHFIGEKTYFECPQYLAGWDAVILPYKSNRPVRAFPSAQIAGLLAAGCPVVATTVRDIIRPYGEEGLVSIAQNETEMARALGDILKNQSGQWLESVDRFLAEHDWDSLFIKMKEVVRRAYNSQFKSESRESVLVKNPESLASGI